MGSIGWGFWEASYFRIGALFPTAEFFEFIDAFKALKNIALLDRSC